MPAYSLLFERDAEYRFTEAGNLEITFRNKPPMKFRALYTGMGVLTFQWVSTGKSASWQCKENITMPNKAEFKETSDSDGTQLITCELERDLFFPFSGIVKQNMSGSIVAPAVHFDIELGTDMWAFLLRSPWFSYKVSPEKETLSVTHGSSQAMATLSTTSYGQHQTSIPILDIELTSNGTDFHGVSLKMKRELSGFKMEEPIGRVPMNGNQTFSWSPIFRAIDTVFIFHSQMSLNDFEKFLQWSGAQLSSGVFSHGVVSDYVLEDGPSMNYVLDLTGERGFLQDVHDESKITFAYG